MAKATFFFDAPGERFSTDDPLLREVPGSGGAPSVPIAPSVSLDTDEGYVVGWHDKPYGPAVAVDVTISADTDLSGLVIGLVNGGGSGESGPRDPSDFDFGSAAFIRGSGGIYLANYPDPLVLVHSTPPMVNGDVIGLRSWMRQYESGSIFFRGTEYVLSDGCGAEFAVLRGGAFSAPTIIHVPPMTPSGGGLPSLFTPPEFPAARWVGHGIELGSVYGNVPVQTGHHRRRRVYTQIPRIVAVSWDLTLEQMQAFYKWYEETLNAGLAEFSLQVANQGPGLVWWRARFVEPYTAEANESGQAFWVSAKVLLSEEGTSSSPYLPEMAANVDVSLFGTATLSVSVDLGADISVGLLPSNLLYASISIPLNVASFALREDGYFTLREDGFRVLREN